MTIDQDYKNFVKKQIKPGFAWFFDIHSLFYYVLFLILIGLLYFGYALISEQFTTPFGGDFVMQGMTFAFDFYDTWWAFFKTGKFPLWNENIYLGADSICANSFYGLFSPFVFPLLFFPRSWIPHVLALISIIRIVVGALFFRIYLKYLGVKEKTARLFSIAYAFSGWMSFNLWFNNFYEVLTFLPLIFFGIEKVIKEKKIWALSLGIFLLCVSNYFYILTVGIFGVLYSGFRYFQTLKTRNKRDNWLVLAFGVLGFAVGFGLTAFASIPSIMTGMSIPRATSQTYLENLKTAFVSKDFQKAFDLIFITWDRDDYQFLYPFISFFYPTISCRFVSLFEKNFDNLSSGLYITSPAIIMLFASMYLSKKNHKFSHFIAIGFLTICLFVPFVYELIGAFSIMYSRWVIVIPTFALAYIALNFDKREEIPRNVIIISGLITLAITLAVYFAASDVIASQEKGDANDIEPIGAKIFVLIYEIVVIAISVSFLAGFWKKPKRLYLALNSVIAIEVIAMGIAVCNCHGLSSYQNVVYGGKESFKGEREIVSRLIEQDKNGFYRIFSTTSTDYQSNLQLAVGYNGANTFHTFYNQNVEDFNNMEGLMDESGWAGGEYSRRYLLGQFLGYKYMITKNGQTSYYSTQDGKRTRHVYEPNVPLGYEMIDESDEFRVYENKYHINFGLGYDTLFKKGNNEDPKIKRNNFYDTGEQNYLLRNDEALFKGAILNDEDVDEIMKGHPDLTLDETMSKTSMMSMDFDTKYYLATKSFDPNKPNEFINSDYELSPGENNTFVDSKGNIVIENDKLINKESQGKLMIVLSDLEFNGGGDISEGIYYALQYPLKKNKNYNATVFLLSGDDEHVERYDNLNWTRQRIWYSRFYRGLYSKEGLKKIVIVVNGDHVYRNFDLYAKPFQNYINLYNDLQKNALINPKKSINRYTFSTNFDKEKFVVTQLAYHHGFKVKIKKKDGKILTPKIYNSQGGFVGFVAPKGEAEHEISYKTPQISSGIAITCLSAAFYVGGVLTIFFLEKRRLKKTIS